MKIIAAVVVSVCLLSVAHAQGVGLVPPFVHVSVDTKGLAIGTLNGPGEQTLSGRIVVRVVANCPHEVDASFGGFRRNDKTEIPARAVSLAINGTPVPGKGKQVTVANSRSATPPQGVELPLDVVFNIRGGGLYPAGRYVGTIMLTVVPMP